MYLICKLLYIAIFALLSAAPPYLPLYYSDVLHFSSDQIGLVLAIAPFVQSIACPLWSLVVDKRPRLHGAIMALTSFLGGSAIMGIMVIGHVASSSNLGAPIVFGISNTVLVTVTSALALAFAFFTLPNMSLVDSAVMKILGPNKILYGEQRLWGSVSAGLSILLVGQLISLTNNYDMLFYVFGASTLVFMGLSFSVDVDTQQNQYVAAPELLNDSGLQHVSSYNNNLTTVPTSSDAEKLLNARMPINNYSSIPSDQNNSANRYDLFKTDSIASAHTIREEADETLDTLGHIDLGLAISRIASIDQSLAGLREVTTGGIPPEAKSVFKSFRVITFLMTTLLFGVVLSIIINFLFLFLSRDLHMPASWIGWTGPTTGATELLCFCFSKQLTELFGVTNMILIAHIATIVRCLIYTILPSDSFFTNVSALLLQTLHGIGFGIFWATAVSEMDSFFPPEQRSVAQGILGALHFGLGTGLGALVGGYLFEYLGAIWMFRVAALVAAINMCVFYIGRLNRFKLE
ncbi:major facilitator superfamily domain-containing protein [Choanephora cucurbitarum]|nr:major facilitator superfamily domain-containing protein [Choanephora cucurbitarum]